MTIIHSHLNNRWYLILDEYNASTQLGRLTAQHIIETSKRIDKTIFVAKNKSNKTLITTKYQIQ